MSTPIIMEEEGCSIKSRIIDFIDAKTREVVWHGSTTGVITQNSIKLEKKIDEAVKAIFDQYQKDQIL